MHLWTALSAPRPAEGEQAAQGGEGGLGWAFQTVCSSVSAGKHTVRLLCFCTCISGRLRYASKLVGKEEGWCFEVVVGVHVVATGMIPSPRSPGRSQSFAFQSRSQWVGVLCTFVRRTKKWPFGRPRVL